jgi:hypothetical protein
MKPSGDERQPVVIAVDGAAVAALVMGLVGVAAAFLPFVGIVLGGLLGIGGIVAGVVGRRHAADDTDPKRQNLGIATGGIVASSIALLFVALQLVGIFAITGLEVDQFYERMDSLGDLIPGVVESEI